MSLLILIKGLIFGFSIAAPVGPIGILCIQRSLRYGRLSGFFSGLGAATADAMYAAIAAFGLTLISDLLISSQFLFRLLGGAFLLFLGWKTFFTKSTEEIKQGTRKTLFNDFISTFFLTVTNPLTILIFLALFGAIGLSDAEGDFEHAGTLVLGVFAGSALWWLILSEGVTLFRKKVTQKMMTWINRIAGGMIMGFGLLSLLSLIRFPFFS